MSITAFLGGMNTGPGSAALNAFRTLAQAFSGLTGEERGLARAGLAAKNLTGGKPVAAIRDKKGAPDAGSGDEIYLSPRKGKVV